MKKLLISLLLVATLGLFGADNYAYKVSNGRYFPIKVIPSEQADTYKAQGFTVETDKLAVYNKLVSAGQEKEAIRAGINPSFSEKFMVLKTVSKLMALRAMGEMKIATGVYGQDTNVKEILVQFFNSNPSAKLEWDASTEVNLDDPVLKQLLPALQIDPVAVKQKMLELGIAK
jgi:hypothetical protein